MTMRAKGPFDVKVTSYPPYDTGEGAKLARATLDKTFHGDLEGSSVGEMLSAMSDVQGSAGYVAIERVKGTLAGKAGTFVMQHRGVMTRGEPSLVVAIVPDTGTGELRGIRGTMTIQITEGAHHYELEYAIDESA